MRWALLERGGVGRVEAWPASIRHGARRTGCWTERWCRPERLLDGVTAERIRELALLVASAEAVGRGPLVPRHRGRARPHPTPVRPAHRPVPGGQAPPGRHAGLRGAGGGRHLGRGVRFDAEVAPTAAGSDPGEASGASPARLAVQLAQPWPSTATWRRPRGPSRSSGGWASPGSTTPTSICAGPPPSVSWSGAPHRCGPRRPGWPWPASAGTSPSSCPPRPRRLRAELAALVATIAAIEDPLEQRRALAEAGLLVPALARAVGTGRRGRRAAGHRPGLCRGRAPPTQPGRGGLGPAHHHGPWHPGADRAVGGPDPPGRAALVPAVQRAGGRLRPGRPDHPGHPGRGGLDPRRAEGLDLGGRPGRHGHLPGPHQPRRPQAPGDHLLPGGHEVAGHRGAAAAGDHRGRAVQRGLPRRVFRARRPRRRRGRRRVAAGPHHPGQRAGLALVRLGLRRRPRRGAGPDRPPTPSGRTRSPSTVSATCWPRPSRWPSWVCGPPCGRSAGSSPDPSRACANCSGAEFEQRVHEFGLDICGPDGAVTEGEAAVSAHGVLQSKCLTIAGGTSEVQRNVIGERLLGLPRDPEPGR